MIKVKLLSVGKSKELWLEEAIAEYSKRLTGKISFQFDWVKNDEELLEAASKETQLICLDPNGKQMTSVEFADFFNNLGSRPTFVIGGAEGLPASLKKEKHLISLSKMTFTHQMTRLILIEQIYRAHEINRGSSYNK